MPDTVTLTAIRPEDQRTATMLGHVQQLLKLVRRCQVLVLDDELIVQADRYHVVAVLDVAGQRVGVVWEDYFEIGEGA